MMKGFENDGGLLELSASAELSARQFDLISYKGEERYRQPYEYVPAELDGEFTGKYDTRGHQIYRLTHKGGVIFPDRLFAGDGNGATPAHSMTLGRYAIVRIYSESPWKESPVTCIPAPKPGIQPVFCVVDLESESIVHVGGYSCDMMLYGRVLVLSGEGKVVILPDTADGKKHTYVFDSAIEFGKRNGDYLYMFTGCSGDTCKGIIKVDVKDCNVSEM